MKIKIVAQWKHGFLMENDMEMTEGSTSATSNPESLCTYLDGVKNIQNWWITDVKSGKSLYSKEKPFKREIKASTPKRKLKEQTSTPDYASMAKPDLIKAGKALMKEHNNAAKVASIIGKSPTFVRSNCK